MKVKLDDRRVRTRADVAPQLIGPGRAQNRSSRFNTVNSNAIESNISQDHLRPDAACKPAFDHFPKRPPAYVLSANRIPSRACSRGSRGHEIVRAKIGATTRR